jgi:adenylate cyclase
MWNAPIPNQDHAADACRCALGLRSRIEEFNAEQQRQGLPPFATRFGLHTGSAVVGTVGANDRFQYTAMGDTINVAARLETLNKEYGTTILVSAAAREQAGEAFLFTPLGRAHAKGRSEKIDVYELSEAHLVRPANDDAAA